MAALRTILTQAATTAPRASTTVTSRARALHQSAAARLPYKDDMDRESLKPKAHEYTQSGTDDQVAQNPDAAFNPHKTDPDSERAAAAQKPDGSGEGEGKSPLEESPANPAFAGQTTGAQEDRRPGGGGDPAKPSGASNPQKKGKTV